MCFMRFLMVVYGNFKLMSLLIDCSCIGPSNSCCDCDEGVGLPTLVLYVCN